ncbi:unnamed protein product [Clonostachys rosea]|uniref:Transcription factor domain-containing protein n=1 Tax=Bionectria ochroleuca TaxID=29856 RepID=A0ABY6V0K3_BIOOC|nr:unnamed protein product [Clonostachys rosea]
MFPLCEISYKMLWRRALQSLQRQESSMPVSTSKTGFCDSGREPLTIGHADLDIRQFNDFYQSEEDQLSTSQSNEYGAWHSEGSLTSHASNDCVARQPQVQCEILPPQGQDTSQDQLGENTHVGNLTNPSSRLGVLGQRRDASFGPGHASTWHDTVVGLHGPHSDRTVMTQSNHSPNIPEQSRDILNLTASSQSTASHVEDISYDQQAADPGPNFDNTSVLQHNQVSALITDMRERFLTGPDPPLGSGRTNSLSDRNMRYVDGSGFRKSAADRGFLERHAINVRRGVPEDGHSDISWCDIFLREIADAKSNPRALRFDLPGTIYHDIQLKLLPEAAPSPLPDKYMLEKHHLLSRDAFSFMIEQYFDHFHHLHSFLDRSLLSIPVWGWSLCVAAAAIGSRYLDLPELTSFGEHLCSALHELLLREVILPIPATLCAIPSG